MYTFGSPRVGDPAFGARIRVPVFRFRNDSDIVPHVPLGILFRHVGELAFIDGAGHLHRNLTTTMKAMLDPGVPLMSAREARTIQQLMRTGGALEFPLPGFLADHAPVNYSTLVWNIYDASRG